MAPREEADENTSRSTLWLLLALTFSTGMIDALSWLGLNGVFTANMTGNVLIIGMGAVGAGGAHWAPPLAALVIFLLGAATAGRLQRDQPPGWSRCTTAIFAVVGAIVAALGAASLAWPPRHFDASAYLVMSALAFAMGAQGAEAMRLAVPQIITVAVSSAVVGLGISLFIAPHVHSRAGRDLLRRTLAIVALIAGAVAGSLLLQLAFGLGLLAAGVVVIAAAGTMALTRRSVTSSR